MKPILARHSFPSSWIIAAMILILMSLPSTFATESKITVRCHESLEELADSIDASNGVATDGVVTRLDEALRSCADERPGIVEPQPSHSGEHQWTVRKPHGPGALICSPGSASGIGPLFVAIAAPPFVGATTLSADPAPESYSLISTSPPLEQFDAHAASTLSFGFASNTNWGRIDVAGNSFAASSWYVSGACNSMKGLPCTGEGDAALSLGVIEVWMSGYIAVCGV